VDPRALQRPLKDRYRTAPDTARITLRARGAQADLPTACSVDPGTGRPRGAGPQRCRRCGHGRTLGVDKGVPAGLEDIRVTFDIRAPEASAEQLASLAEKTERYCTVLQTLVQPPPTRTEWRTG
jgi:OsmC-like protein